MFTRTSTGALVLAEHVRLAAAGPGGTEQWAALAACVRRGDTVVLTPPANVTFAKVLTVPPLVRARRHPVVRFEAAQAIPRPLEELVWEWAPLSGVAATQVELAALKWETAEQLAAEAEAAGVRLTAIFGRATVLRRALEHNYPELRGAAVVAEVRGGTALLVGAVGGVGTVRLVGLPEPAAVAAGAGGAPVGEADLRARRLVLEVRRLVGEDGAAEGRPPATLLLAGADAPEPEAVATAGIDGLAVERFDALRHVGSAAAVDRSAAEDRECAALVGAAVAVVTADSPNLLPEARRRENRFRRRRWIWLAAPIAAALVLWGASFWTHLATERTRARSAALVRELEPWRAARREVERQRLEIESCQDIAVTLDALERARTAWARLLAESEQRLGGRDGMWLEIWQMSGSGDGGSAVDADGVARHRLLVAGCTLDPGPDGRRGLERVRELWREWAAADLVVAIEEERFDSGVPGLLRFRGVVVLRPEAEL